MWIIENIETNQYGNSLEDINENQEEQSTYYEESFKPLNILGGMIKKFLEGKVGTS